MMDLILTIFAAVGILAIIVAVFLTILWVGFKMGRQTIDKPLPPLIKPKQSSLMEEDPWYEPMHGRPQAHTPTVEVK